MIKISVEKSFFGQFKIRYENKNKEIFFFFSQTLFNRNLIEFSIRDYLRIIYSIWKILNLFIL
jgi:hypothetical protein